MAKKHPGMAIRRERRAAEMTQLRLALAINRSPSFIVTFEAGKPSNTATKAEIAAMRRAIRAHKAAA